MHARILFQSWHSRQARLLSAIHDIWPLALNGLDFLHWIAFRGRWEEDRIRDSLLRSLGHFGIADAVDSHLIEIPSHDLAVSGLAFGPFCTYVVHRYVVCLLVWNRLGHFGWI
jgi:hypothetical protein